MICSGGHCVAKKSTSKQFVKKTAKKAPIVRKAAPKKKGAAKKKDGHGNTGGGGGHSGGLRYIIQPEEGPFGAGPGH
jgi:hypothetical protein